MLNTNNLIDVMIIEDDEVAAVSYSKFIEKIDSLKVSFIANTGEQALELLENYQPKLILLDVFLPDIHGIELLWKIRNKYRNIDIILITASNDKKSVAEAIRGGVFSYLIKPVMMNRFISTLEKYKSITSKLDQKELFVQNEVDSLFLTSETSSKSTEVPSIKNFPKGIDKLTLNRIKEIIVNLSESVNADECAALAGVSHSTSRRYLEYLASEDLIEITIHHGTVGRPERRYQLKQPN
ncbi:response regulator [Halalkalibacter alkaliphilus]|jgi:two-component system CitB family response regulator|uniref:Response regulator n=1 Tax=Halalkalibacter alkaliphilus TaxID=2917993 RepID=A0A9X1ZVQ3_9BACI|nr:response regulator [Halalkalibacter alkaliphilus]MCL7745503.1 response regulator [Halalkalibacter alkaliphilus]